MSNSCRPSTRCCLEQDAARRRDWRKPSSMPCGLSRPQPWARAQQGPYWLGAELSLADIAVYPHMERLCVLEAYRDIAVPAECGRLREWLSVMAERPSVQQTAHDADFHIAVLRTLCGRHRRWHNRARYASLSMATAVSCRNDAKLNPVLVLNGERCLFGRWHMLLFPRTEQLVANRNLRAIFA